MVKDYSTAFHSLLNHVQVIYSIQREMTFVQTSFDLVIRNDTWCQTDGVNCGIYLAYIYLILSISDFQEINDPIRMRKWVHNIYQVYGSAEDKNELPEMTIAPNIPRLNQAENIFMKKIRIALKFCLVKLLNAKIDLSVIIRDVMVLT